MTKYAIVDSAQHGGFYKRLNRYGVAYRSLFEGYAESNLIEIAPLLVQISTDGGSVSHVRGEIKNLAQSRPAVSYIESRLSVDALAAHLRKFHIIDLPGRKAMILRWYDTRVLPAWIQVLNAAQKEYFTKGVDSWLYHDRFGDVCALDIFPTSVDPSSPRVKLDASQYTQLCSAGETDSLIFRLRKIIPDELAGVPYRNLYSFVSKHQDIAHKNGIHGLDDQAQWLVLALYTGGAYLESPEVLVYLEMAGSVAKAEFQDWMDDLPGHVWELGLPLWDACRSHADSCPITDG